MVRNYRIKAEFTHTWLHFICLLNKRIILPAILKVVAMAATTKTKLLSKGPGTFAPLNWVFCVCF